MLIFLLTGGLATWRHYVIRLLLWRSHTFPWSAQAFLDDATARILLRRSGGGYSFLHRRLLDFFADHPTPTAAKETNGPAPSSLVQQRQD